MSSLFNGLEQALHSGSWYVFLIVFFSGILTSFTPCIYPMIPITFGVIVGQNPGSKSRRHTFILSLVYVFGIAITYALLGIIAVASGSIFGSLSSNALVLFVIANVCILLGLSMLDLFMIRIPFITTLASNHLKGGSLTGVLMLGIVFGLIASPCSAPVLGTILAYVSTSKSYLFGSTLLFTYALGVGSLLVVVGFLAGSLAFLPKSGKWMLIVKRLFGFVMIAMGEYFLIEVGKNLF